MTLKDKLRIAGIIQVKIAENTGYTEAYVNKVLNGSRSSSKVTNEATRLLSEFLAKNPAFKEVFNG